jgi:hypothetical protein
MRAGRETVASSQSAVRRRPESKACEVDLIRAGAWRSLSRETAEKVERRRPRIRSTPFTRTRVSEQELELGGVLDRKRNVRGADGDELRTRILLDCSRKHCARRGRQPRNATACPLQDMRGVSFLDSPVPEPDFVEIAPVEIASLRVRESVERRRAEVLTTEQRAT